MDAAGDDGRTNDYPLEDRGVCVDFGWIHVDVEKIPITDSPSSSAGERESYEMTQRPLAHL